MAKAPQQDLVHVVAGGECLSSIAEEYGHFWSSLWNDEANAGLAAAGRTPEVLLANDRVTVRALRQKTESCATGKRHTFRRKGVPSSLAIQFRRGGTPRAGEAYRLTVDGVERPPGTLDGEGWLRVPIACSAKRGVIVIGTGVDQQTHELQLGWLDPVTEPIGVAARLDQLGFACPSVDALEPALRAFQEREGLEVTGTADEATRARLVAVHGS